MVTHNGELAERYSSRIIRLLDGEVQADSNPPTGNEPKAAAIGKKFKKTAMAPVTAVSLSFKNLLTKKGRTITTSIACSIGIIGVALVFALSSGLSGYMTQIQSDSLAGLPITINEDMEPVQHGGEEWSLTAQSPEGLYTGDNVLYSYDSVANTIDHYNVLTGEYFDYIANIETALPGAVNDVTYVRGIEMNVLAKGSDSVVKFKTSKTESDEALPADEVKLYWQEVTDNEELILSLYDLVGEGSRLPKEKNEVALVVNEYNRIDAEFFGRLGMPPNTSEYQLTDFIGKTILKVIPNDAFYTQTSGGLFNAANISDYEGLYNGSGGLDLTIVGVLRIKPDAASVEQYLQPGLIYTTALTDYCLESGAASEIAAAQATSNIDVVSNVPFADDDAKKDAMQRYGANTTPTGINIYPKDFAGKDAIKAYLDAYNEGRPAAEQMVYDDIAQVLESSFGSILNTVTYVLIGFAAISLLVSTIMIAIITYVSVMERTKEIGILRSVGARKKDISRLFNAEAAIIGLVSGCLGIGLSYLLTIVIDMIVTSLVGVSGIPDLTLFHSTLLILGSVVLTLIASLFPAKMAAKKDPVEALRTE